MCRNRRLLGQTGQIVDADFPEHGIIEWQQWKYESFNLETIQHATVQVPNRSALSKAGEDKA
jgi:hypothetical protein